MFKHFSRLSDAVHFMALCKKQWPSSRLHLTSNLIQSCFWVEVKSNG